MNDLDEVIAEDVYWESRQELDDVVGVPPYDVDAVADRIMASFSRLPQFLFGGDVRVLDLGCGTGRLTNYLARRIVGPYTEVHGVDISERLLARAVEDRDPAATFWHGDGRRLPPYLGGRFTAAYSVTMFQHIPPEAMWGYLREVGQRLQPSGIFLFTVAVGEIDTFLNHQISDVGALAAELGRLYPGGVTVIHDEPSEGVHGWTWIEARK